MDTSDTGTVGLALSVCAVNEVFGSDFELPIFGFNWPVNDEGFVITVGIHNWCHCNKKWAPIQKARNLDGNREIIPIPVGQ